MDNHLQSHNQLAWRIAFLLSLLCGVWLIVHPQTHQRADDTCEGPPPPAHACCRCLRHQSRPCVATTSQGCCCCCCSEDLQSRRLPAGCPVQHLHARAAAASLPRAAGRLKTDCTGQVAQEILILSAKRPGPVTQPADPTQTMMNLNPRASPRDQGYTHAD